MLDAINFSNLNFIRIVLSLIEIWNHRILLILDHVYLTPYVNQVFQKIFIKTCKAYSNHFYAQ